MKIEKNKVVFISVLLVVVVFIIAYSLMIYKSSDDAVQPGITEPSVPILGTQEKKYDSKLDAINDLKEVRQNNAPSIYDEKVLDSIEVNDDLELIVQENLDSIYIRPEKIYNKVVDISEKGAIEAEESISNLGVKSVSNNKERALNHQLFFASTTSLELTRTVKDSSSVSVEIDGDQVIQANSRLRMRLTEDTKISGQAFAKNTPVYGLVSFQPNRVLIAIDHIEQLPIKFKAFDLQDGSEGIYVENNFRAEASREVVNDIIQDINIPTIPQLSGITKVLQRSNRNVKVTVLNNYKLVLRNQ